MRVGKFWNESDVNMLLEKAEKYKGPKQVSRGQVYI